jgi:phage tail-like protein
VAVTVDHYLVAGVIDPPGLLVFDLHTASPPRQLCWPVPLVPFDIAPAVGGGVFVLDRDNARFWRLDRHFNVRPHVDRRAPPPPAAAAGPTFEPIDGSAHDPGGVMSLSPAQLIEVATSLGGIDAVAIESLPDGSVLVLDRAVDPSRPFSKIYRYRADVPPGTPPESLDTEGMRAHVESKSPPFTIEGYDFAFVPQHDGRAGTVPHRLYVVPESGDQVYAFDVTRAAGGLGAPLALSPVPAYFPLRLFGGKGLVAAGNEAYYDSQDRWFSLVDQRRPRYDHEATLWCPARPDLAHPENAPGRAAFDGKVPDCVWHRLMLDARLPPTTAVEVWSRAANDAAHLDALEWRREPSPRLRRTGSEQPFAGREPVDGEGTWELLFQAARGRYLQLKLVLRGDGRSTPRLRALRAYYPRFSYLERYLPAVYREDPESASFLDRFLANVEGSYTAIEDKIAAAQVLWDVRSAPDDVLPWLAHWYGIALDPRWEPARRRLFVACAMDFFQFRGTVAGLRMALSLALDSCVDEVEFGGRRPRPTRNGIRIVEKFRARRRPGVALGDATALSGPRRVERTRRWTPDQGRDELRRRFTETRDPDAARAGRLDDFALTAPAAPDAATRWRAFAEATLDFVPAATNADAGAWQRFLARRYRRVGALNAAWQLTAAQAFRSFDAVPLPAELPPDGARLRDWYQFESVVVGMRRAAHQFTVLLPVPIERPLDDAERRRRLDIATRVVEAEKPAHTVFDIKFYWAAFRLGAARLGDDTILGSGSRAPELLPPMVLGQGHLAEGYLAPTHSPRRMTA